MPSGGPRLLRSYQLLVPRFSLSAATIAATFALLLLLLTDVEGQSGERNQGNWVSIRKLKQSPGAWLSATATFHDRFDDWSNFNEGMQNWEVAIRLPATSTPRVLEFMESVRSLSIQITPCTSPLKVTVYSPSNQHQFNRAINQYSHISNPAHSRSFQNADQVFYPALDTRLFGEITSSPEVGPEKIWISIGSNSNIPLSQSISHHFAMVRLFKNEQPVLTNDYPAIPKHVIAPRVRFLDNQKRAAVYVNLEMEIYDNALTRPVSFCVVANNVRPLPQWCSAQLAISQMKYNRRIWAQEHGWQLEKDQYNYTCQRAVFGRSPLNMSLELSDVLISPRRAANVNKNEPHSAPIYLNVYTVNEDSWQFASAGATFILRLPRLRSVDQPQVVMNSRSNINMEERMRSVISANGQCACTLQMPIVFGYTAKDYAADIFVISQTPRIRNPIDARVWPYIVPADHKWQCRASIAERTSLLPGMGRWLCRASTPYNCTSDVTACQTIVHLVELNAPCAPPRRKNIPSKTADNSRCPKIKFHIGSRRAEHSTVRHVNLKSIATVTTKCNKITRWQPRRIAQLNDYNERMNCMIYALRKSLKHKRISQAEGCNHRSQHNCWLLKLVIPSRLARFPLNLHLINQSIFTFRLFIFKHRQHQFNKGPCNCKIVQSKKCQRCILDAQQLYLNNQQTQCAPPSCLQIHSFEEAVNGVLLKIKRQVQRPRPKRHQRNIVLFQIYVSPKNNTCGHHMSNTNVNSCIDAATLVALKSVTEPN